MRASLCAGLVSRHYNGSALAVLGLGSGAGAALAAALGGWGNGAPAPQAVVAICPTRYDLPANPVSEAASISCQCPGRG